MPVQINVGHPTNLASILQKGIDCSFSRMILLTVSENGEIQGYISDDELRLPKVGRYQKFRLFIGVEQLISKDDEGSYKGELNFITPTCSAEDVEHKISSILESRQGDHMAIYGQVEVEGSSCFVIEISLDCSAIQSLHRKVSRDPEAHEKPFRKASALYEHGGLSHGLGQILSARRAVFPDAIELRIPEDEVPAMLGMRGPSYALTQEAIAAFGNNSCVESAIYVRLPIDGLSSDKALSELTDRTSQKRAIPLKEGLSIYDAQESKPLRFGGTVFDVIENLDKQCASPSGEMPRQEDLSARFQEPMFREAIKEYVINAYCHGEWNNGHDYTRDERHSWWFGNAVAIVEAENRIEVLNRKQREVQLEGIRAAGSLYPKGLNPVHAILKDTGLAHGRNIGLQLARQRLLRAGFPAPIHIRDINFFRVVLPESNEFDTVFVDPDPKKDRDRLHLIYAVRLAIVLRTLNENIVSSALKVSLDDAASMLSSAELNGLIKKQLTAGKYVNHLQRWTGRQTYYPDSQPSYDLVDEGAARAFLVELEGQLERVTSPEGMSPSGVFSLSRWSMGMLVKKDIKNVIADIFRKEALFGSASDNLADEFYDKIKDFRSALGEAY